MKEDIHKVPKNDPCRCPNLPCSILSIKTMITNWEIPEPLQFPSSENYLVSFERRLLSHVWNRKVGKWLFGYCFWKMFLFWKIRNNMNRFSNSEKLKKYWTHFCSQMCFLCFPYSPSLLEQKTFLKTRNLTDRNTLSFFFFRLLA